MHSVAVWRCVAISALICSVVSFAWSQASGSAAKRPFTFEDMMALKRIGEPVLSPDGKWVVFAAIDVNLEEHTRKSYLWIVPSEGGGTRGLTQPQTTPPRPRFP